MLVSRTILARILVSLTTFCAFFLLGELISASNFVEYNYILICLNLATIFSTFGGIQAISKYAAEKTVGRNSAAILIALRSALFSCIVLCLYISIAGDFAFWVFLVFPYTFFFVYLDAIRYFNGFDDNSVMLAFKTIYIKNLILALSPIFLILLTVDFENSSLSPVMLVSFSIFCLSAYSIFFIFHRRELPLIETKDIWVIKLSGHQMSAFLIAVMGSALAYIEQLAATQLLAENDAKSYLYAIRILGVVSMIIVPISYFYQPSTKEKKSSLSPKKSPLLYAIVLVQFIGGLLLIFFPYDVVELNSGSSFWNEHFNKVFYLGGIMLAFRSLEAIASLSSFKVYLNQMQTEVVYYYVPIFTAVMIYTQLVNINNMTELAIVFGIPIILFHSINIYYGEKRAA